MNPRMRVLLLVGSPRPRHSTSAELAGDLYKKLVRRGVGVKTFQISRYVKNEKRLQELLWEMDRADTLILFSPLYVDSLPAPVTAFMEAAVRHRKMVKSLSRKRFGAVVNCGLPDASQNDIAVAICRIFAREAGFLWIGGLALGGGEAIGGRPLSRLRPMAVNVLRSLSITAKAVARGEPIPFKAVRLMERPLVPWPLYIWLASVWFFREARKKGGDRKIHDRPYARLDPSGSRTRE